MIVVLRLDVDDRDLEILAGYYGKRRATRVDVRDFAKALFAETLYHMEADRIAREEQRALWAAEEDDDDPFEGFGDEGPE